MTDEEIELDYLENTELEKELDEQHKNEQPHCDDCEYIGQPYPQTNLCPKCGSNMKIPGKTYGDDFDEDLKDIGIDPKDITPTTSRPRQ